MNRREFFRRTVPAVAVTVAAVQSGWAMDFFKRILGRVLTAVERSPQWASEIEQQMAYQAKMAMNAMAQKIAQQFYGYPSGVFA